VFGQLGWGEMLVLLLVGLFVFGPERLPTIARDAAKIIKQFRDTARGMRDELQAELGPEIGDLDLKSLNPRTFVEKHLLGDDDDPTPAPDPPSLTKPSAEHVPLTKPATTVRRSEATPYDDDAT
jgi:sec-independent protein translocase protein TatB